MALNILLQLAICSEPCRFIEDDEVDALYRSDQLVLGFTDDPGDLGLRPMVLQGSQCG